MSARCLIERFFFFLSFLKFKPKAINSSVFLTFCTTRSSVRVDFYYVACMPYFIIFVLQARTKMKQTTDTTKTDFEPQTFSFDSEVNISVTKEKITAVAENGSTTIESHSIDNFSHRTYSEARLSAFALIARTFGVGIVLLFFVKNQWGAMAFV